MNKHTNTNRTQKLIKKNKRRYRLHAAFSAVFFAGFLLAVAFCSLVFSATKTNAGSPDTGGYTKMYKSIMIEQGDSLWDIADQYMSVGYDNKADYIEEILEMNGLNSTTIHCGEYLCIPYYA